jgi:hypothetical protein
MSNSPKAEAIEIFCKYVVRNGKIIYPKKARCFHFWIKVRKK